MAGDGYRQLPLTPPEKEDETQGPGQPRWLVFDLETQRTADEVGGWHRIRDMGLSAAVTLDVHAVTYQTYTEPDAQQLIADLLAADRVIGYNLLRFDYELLRGYGAQGLETVETTDMMVDLTAVLGWRPSLQAVAAATLGHGKSADGLQAVRWYRAGQLDKVIDYCRRDVEVTWQVYEFGRQNGFVSVRDRRGRLHRLPVRWE